MQKGSDMTASPSTGTHRNWYWVTSQQMGRNKKGLRKAGDTSTVTRTCQRHSLCGTMRGSLYINAKRPVFPKIPFKK